MTFWAETVQGDKMLLGAPKRAVLMRDRGAPADLLKVVFPADKLWESLRKVFVYDSGELIFGGVVDEQNSRLLSDGLTIELICRSFAAVLIDNEVLPQTIRNPSLKLLWERYIKPLGFSEIEGDMEPRRGEIVIEKGESCFAVLQKYCKIFFGTVPYLNEEGKIFCVPRDKNRREISDICSFEISEKFCKRISRVYMQNNIGVYAALFSNSAAKEITRVRYVSSSSGKTPQELINNGERDSFSLTVTCMGAHYVPINTKIDISSPRYGEFLNCEVESIVYKLDDKGETTKFVLKKEHNHVDYNSVK